MYRQGEPAQKVFVVADGYFQVSRKLVREDEPDGDQPNALMQYIRPDVQAAVSNLVPRKLQTHTSNLLTLGRGAIIGLQEAVNHEREYQSTV